MFLICDILLCVSVGSLYLQRTLLNGLSPFTTIPLTSVTFRLPTVPGRVPFRTSGIPEGPPAGTHQLPE